MFLIDLSRIISLLEVRKKVKLGKIPGAYKSIQPAESLRLNPFKLCRLNKMIFSNIIFCFSKDNNFKKPLLDTLVFGVYYLNGCSMV